MDLGVITSFVADAFVPALTRFHCPIDCVLKFDKPKTYCLKRRIWSYQRGDFQEYRTQLASVDWDFIDNDNSDCVADEIVNVIIKTATRTIPNKIATIRQHDIPWMNNSIRKLIKKSQTIQTFKH